MISWQAIGKKIYTKWLEMRYTPAQLQQCKTIYFGSALWVLFFYLALFNAMFSITPHNNVIPHRLSWGFEWLPPTSITSNRSIHLTGSFWLSTDVPKLSPTIISIFASIVVIRRFLLMFSFLALSLLGTPHNLLSMCVSATWTLVCHMFVALHSGPHKYTRPNCLSFKRSPFNLCSIC